MKLHWFLPTTGGDGRPVVSRGHGVEHGVAGRPDGVACLGQVARSVQQPGCEAATSQSVPGGRLPLDLVTRGESHEQASADPHLEGVYEFGAARASVPFGARSAAS